LYGVRWPPLLSAGSASRDKIRPHRKFVGQVASAARQSKTKHKTTQLHEVTPKTCVVMRQRNGHYNRSGLVVHVRWHPYKPIPAKFPPFELESKGKNAEEPRNRAEWVKAIVGELLKDLRPVQRKSS
jgi:hypothetical protein